jgi:uncharacterized RDD family membrane protein YckC
MDKKFEYAGFNLRVMAAIIDTMWTAILLMPVFTILHFIFFPEIPVDAMTKFKLGQELSYEEEVEMKKIMFFATVDNLLQFVVFSGIIFIFWKKFSSTPGKMLLRMKILDAKTGNEPSTKQLILRIIGYIPSTFLLGLGFILVAIDKKRQGLHDKIAGTIVVKEGKGIDLYFWKKFIKKNEKS